MLSKEEGALMLLQIRRCMRWSDTCQTSWVLRPIPGQHELVKRSQICTAVVEPHVSGVRKHSPVTV